MSGSNHRRQQSSGTLSAEPDEPTQNDEEPYWANDGSEYTHPSHAATSGPFDAYTDRASRKSANVQLRRLGLRPGQRIVYVFDFGDEWRVDLRLKTIVAPEECAYPRIVARGAEAPPQYPGWDEDAA